MVSEKVAGPHLRQEGGIFGIMGLPRDLVLVLLDHAVRVLLFDADVLRNSSCTKGKNSA